MPTRPACPASTVDYRDGEPLTVTCQGLAGHRGAHVYSIEWITRDLWGGRGAHATTGR